MKRFLFMVLMFALCGCGDSGGKSSTTANSNSETVSGAGATFPAPLYAKWTAAFNAANAGMKVDYQAIGSGGGIKGITDRTIQFAGSDAPMTDEQLKAAPAPILHLPTVSGPVAIVVNLPGSADLKLNGDVLAGIYLGKILKWNDAKIAALNPGVTLADKDIAVAHRADGSGTTWIFTNYLSKVSADWKNGPGNATSVKWPCGNGGKGSDGVAQLVSKVEGGIGYVELAYAEKAQLKPIALINKAGKVVKCTIEGVEEAVKNSADVPDDLRVSITDAPGDGSYPICGFTYLLVYQDLSYLKNKPLAEAVVKFIGWGEGDGQKLAKPEYSPLGGAFPGKVEAKLKSIVFEGAPLLK